METLRLKRHQNIWTKWKKGRKREDHVKETPSEENWSHIVDFLSQIWCSSKVVIWWKVAIGLTIAEIIADIGYHELWTKCKHWLKNCNRVYACQAEKTILRTKCQSKSSCAEFDPIRDEREKHQGQNINMGKAPMEKILTNSWFLFWDISRRVISAVSWANNQYLLGRKKVKYNNKSRSQLKIQFPTVMIIKNLQNLTIEILENSPRM